MQKRPFDIRFVLITAALVIFFSIGVLSCTKKEDLLERYTASPVKNNEITSLNEQLFAKAQITVFEAENLNTKTRVSSRGHITLSLLGQIKVKGLTAREAETKIEALYRQKYIKDPHVSIFVEEHISQRITLVGQLKKPGPYDYFSQQRLLDVLALAGGFSEKAGNTIQIRRNNANSGEPNVFVIFREQLIKGGKTELNIEIMGGDTIFVPEAGQFFIDGAVRRPGNYSITEKMVVKQALMTSGGIRPYAEKESFILIRDVEGERKVFELHFDSPEDLSIKVENNDIIIVKASTWGKIVHGGRVNIGIPGLGVGFEDPEYK